MNEDEKNDIWNKLYQNCYGDYVFHEDSAEHSEIEVERKGGRKFLVMQGLSMYETILVPVSTTKYHKSSNYWKEKF